MKFRNEYDSLGSVKVPHDKYWGASTQRSNKHFDIGDFLVRPIVIKSIAMIKKAAAIVNTRNKSLDKKISKAIIKAANEASGLILRIDDVIASGKQEAGAGMPGGPMMTPGSMPMMGGM